jgi:hypothetical protein
MGKKNSVDAKIALGRHEGFEPSTSGTTIRRSTKLS